MVIDESWYEQPPDVPVHTCAGGIVFRAEDHKILIALVQVNGYPYYILPKGRVKPEESLDSAARREIMEEAGLNRLNFISELGVRVRLNFKKSAWKIVHYFMYVTDQVEGVPTDKKHVYRVEFFPVDELPELLWPEQRELIEESRNLMEEYARSNR